MSAEVDLPLYVILPFVFVRGYADKLFEHSAEIENVGISENACGTCNTVTFQQMFCLSHSDRGTVFLRRHTEIFMKYADEMRL